MRSDCDCVPMRQSCYQQHSDCNITCRVRCFYSKGALLVLLWMTLISTTVWSLIKLNMFAALSQEPKDSIGQYSRLALLPAMPFIVFAPLSGWLADARFGNYAVFKAGSVLLFVSATMGCVCTLVLENVDMNSTLSIAVRFLLYISLAYIGATACLVTALQLGLDQMPDASASNITSFIAWFVFSFFAGFWITETLFSVPLLCASDSLTRQQLSLVTNWSVQILTLLPAVCMCIVCCSMFLLAPKWLTIEPKSPKSLKTIYQVLKFAVKHKAPVNRSALTYWEEDIPSRIDLGKSRYGGPFTTEQVEDVKTFFKILIVLLPAYTVLLALCLNNVLVIEPMQGLSSCASGFVYTFTYSPWWCVIITSLMYELAIYPLLQYRLPTILKRMGIVSLLIVVVNIGYLIVSIVSFTLSLQLQPWPRVVYSICLGSLITLLFTWSFEFVCAQSPYNMRGLFAGYVNFLNMLSISLGALVTLLFNSSDVCNKKYCSVIQNSLGVLLSLVGFVLLCVLARWYKMRVRDDNFSAQRLVEEVYDRYLSHEQ